jgi:hypothetical protein
MRIRDINPTDQSLTPLGLAGSTRSEMDDRTGEPIRCDAPMRSEDAQREALPADREQAERQVQAARRPRRGAPVGAERGLAARREDQGGHCSAKSNPSLAARRDADAAEGQVKDRRLYVDDTLHQPPAGPPPVLSEVERAEIEARHREHREHGDSVYDQLLLDAQACGRAMQYSPRLDSPAEWDAAVSKSLEDYRSGRSLMDQLGADRLQDPATTAMLLAIRRGLIEENNATSMGELVLIDMAVIAFANAMRLQSIVGNTSLIIEGELFGQPTLRAKWENVYGGRPPEIQGLAVDEHVAKLRDSIMPLIERFHRLARESIAALARRRHAPAASVENIEPLPIVLAVPYA